jgi:hypothetical protein
VRKNAPDGGTAAMGAATMPRDQCRWRKQQHTCAGHGVVWLRVRAAGALHMKRVLGGPSRKTRGDGLNTPSTSGARTRCRCVCESYVGLAQNWPWDDVRQTAQQTRRRVQAGRRKRPAHTHTHTHTHTHILSALACARARHHRSVSWRGENAPTRQAGQHTHVLRGRARTTRTSPAPHAPTRQVKCAVRSAVVSA